MKFNLKQKLQEWGLVEPEQEMISPIVKNPQPRSPEEMAFREDNARTMKYIGERRNESKNIFEKLFGPVSIVGVGNNQDAPIPGLVDEGVEPTREPRVAQAQEVQQSEPSQKFTFNQLPDPVDNKQPIPSNLETAIDEASRIYGLDPKVIASVLANESGGIGYNVPPESVGPDGERGITQIIPEYHFRGSQFKNPQEYGDAIANDPNLAIREMARIISANLENNGGDLYQAIKAYNGSGERADKYARVALARIGYQ